MFVFVPLNKKSRKYVRLLWSGNLYEFICLFLWPTASTADIPKIIENSVEFRQFNIRLIIYLYDVFVSGRTMEEGLMSCQSVIYKININSNSGIRIFGMTINSKEMTLSLPKWKMENIRNIYLSILGVLK